MPAATKPHDNERLEATRMSIGDHLEELRRRVILALIGVFVGTSVCLFFGKTLLRFVCQPAVAVLQVNDLPTRLQTLSVQEPFLIWARVGVLGGIIATIPFILYQLWAFISLGLYKNERKFVLVTVPTSVGLFAAGVLFFHFIVLPIVLNFFITFGQDFTLGDPTPSSLQSALLAVKKDDATTQPVDVLLPPTVPVLADDPPKPADGSVWINRKTMQMRIAVGDDVRTIQTLPTARHSLLDSQFRLGEYVSFVLSLYLAFGLAFQLPIVVASLTIFGLVSIKTMTRSRRIVYFCIFVAAAILTPPDVVSQVALGLPMVLLFEAGLFAARMWERNHGDNTADDAPAR